MRPKRLRTFVAIVSTTGMLALGTVLSPVADAGLTDTLSAGQTLVTGQSLESADGRFKAIMQTDGNFVEYGPGGAVWSTRTGSGNGTQIRMQQDGNLVVYSPTGVAQWWSASSGSSGDRLVLQSDGNLVVYSVGGLPLWDYASGLLGYEQDTLPTGGAMATGQSLESADGRFKAIMQTDGNFVEYGPGGAVWSTRTGSGNGTQIRMQQDGNLVVYSPTGVAQWWSASSGTSGDRLVLQSDGNLVIYNNVGSALWDYGSGLLGSPGPVDDYPAQWRNVQQDSVIDSWREYNRECTSFAAWRLHSREHFEMPFHDNANGWGADARARGYTVNSSPTVGSIAWTTAGYNGHVAYVETISGSTVTIEDYNSNFKGTWAVHYNVPAATYQYIHFAS